MVGRKSILSIKKINEDITFNLDIATLVEHKNKLVSVIYSILALYEVDNVVEKVHQSTYIVRGLAKHEFADNIIADTLEEYIDWYKNLSGL